MAVKIDVQWADNTKDLKTALQQGTDAIYATKAGADKLVQAFSGDKLIEAAHRMVAAISEVGGAEKLTNAERDRTNALLDKAIQKYAALGKEAPSALVATYESTKKASDATDGWTGSLVKLGQSWAASIAGGELLHDAVLKAIDVFKDMLTILPELAIEGSKVAGIEKNFDKLTEAAGLTASTLMTTLRTATHNTVTDFDLMKRVNQDLAAGMNLTEAQFATLSKGAFALAKATGVDVKDALDTMSDAMLTGRTRSLAMLTGKISQTDAEKAYATSLMSTAEHLTDEGKLEASRVAILDAVGKATARVGEQTDGLGTIVKQASVWWQNFQEDLGKTIATSPVLKAELLAIRDALVDAFGGQQQTLMDAIARKIDDLVLNMIGLARAGIDTAGMIAKEWYALYKVVGDVAQIIQGNVLVLELAALKVAEFGARFSSGAEARQRYAEDVTRINANIQSLMETMTARGKALQDADAAQATIDDHTAKYTKTLNDLEAKVRAAKKAAEEFVGPIQDGADAQQHAADQGKKHAQQLQASKEELAKTAKAAEDYATAWYNLSTLGQTTQDTLAGLNPQLRAQATYYANLGAEVSDLIKAFPGLTEAQAKALKQQTEDLKAASKVVSEIRDKWEAGTTKLNESLLVVNSTELISIKQHLDLAAAMKMVEQSIPPTVAGFFGAADALEHVGLKSTELRDLQVRLALQTKSLGDVFRDTFKQLPGIMEKAFEGGGGAEGAAKAFGAVLADNLIKGYEDQIKKSGKTISARQQTALDVGTTAGGAIGGGFGGPTGAMIGSVASSVAGTALIAGGAFGGAAAGVGGAIALGATTAGIGAAAVGVYLLAKHFLTVSQNEKDARAEFQKLQDQYGSLPDTIKGVGDAYALMGYSGARAQADIKRALDASHDSAQAEDAALRPILEVLDAAAKRTEELNAKTAEVATGLDDLTAAGQAFGGHIPDQFKAAVRELANMKGVTDDERKALLALAADVKPNFEELTKTAEKYGITLEGLGKSFQQANIEGRAKDITDDFEALTKAGGDAGGILAGMSDEISKLVQDSKQFGTAIPENMRPLIDELLRAGKLTDENGNKLEDLSGISFEATPIDDSMTKLKDAIDKLRESLEGLAKLQIPPIQVPVTYVAGSGPPGPPPADLPEPVAYATGSGGFKDFGTGTLAVLHGREAVITEAQAMRSDYSVTSATSAPAAAGDVHVHFAISTLDATDFQTVVEQKVFPALVNQLRRGRGLTAMKDVLG